MKFLRSVNLILHQHVGRRVLIVTTGVALLVGVGVATATSSHVGVFSFVPQNTPTQTTHRNSLTRPQSGHSLSPSASPTTKSITSQTTATSAAKATATSNENGSVLPQNASEPSDQTIWSSKLLSLSSTSVTMPAGRYSPVFTASAPEGYVLCEASTIEQNSVQGLQVAWPYGTNCDTKLSLEISPTSTPGTYTVHMFAGTRDRVMNGDYIRYDGYITVVVTPSIDYSLSVSAPQYQAFQFGGVSGFTIGVSVIEGGAYIGSPTVTPEPPYSGICMTQSFVQTARDSYQWSCTLNSYFGSPSWTMTFQGNDGVTQKDSTVQVSY